MTSKVPVRVRCRSFSSRSDIHALLRELVNRRVSVETLRLFRDLALQPPDRRLVINQKVFLSLCVQKEINNVLTDGLTTRERKGLMEMDSLGLSVSLREVGHGLLNIHERWILLKAMSGSLREAKAAAMNRLDLSCSLDDILGNRQDQHE